MISKSEEKKKAIELRRRGKTYTEILSVVPVAKSTLSLWLRSVFLAIPQKQRITRLRREGTRRGWLKRRQNRIDKTRRIKLEARKSVSLLIGDPKWISGVMLYWAEGSKQKDWSVATEIRFSNMDERMLLLFREWAKAYLKISDDEFRYELYIHETANISRATHHWSNVLDTDQSTIRVYRKRGNHSTARKNKYDKYVGVLRITIIRSCDLNRKIAGWIDGLVEYFNRCGIV